MSIAARIRGLDPMSRFVLAGRVVGSIALSVFYLLWARTVPGIAPDVLIAAVVYAAFTVAVIPLVLYGVMSAQRTPFWAGVVVADGVSLGLLTAVTGHLEDPFFAWYVAQAAIIGLALRRRDAWVLSGGLVLSYLSAHLIAHGDAVPVSYAFLLVKVLGLLLVAAAVSVAMGYEERRQALLEANRDELMDLYAQLERSVAELRAVTEITETIHSTLDIDTVGVRLLGTLNRVLDIPASSVYVIDKAKQETVFSASIGVSKADGAAAIAAAGTVEQREASPNGAFGCIDLVSHTETSVVFCADTAVIDSLSPDDRIVLQTVASELVVAVENSRLYKLTKRLAITDEITGLYNYRYLQQRLDEEIGRADRYGKRLSLLMLDIDSFKRVNDVHGHRVGDGVLAEVARVLKSAVREVDVVARYGGEEFSVVLPETDAPGAFIVAEKVREAVSLARFKDEDGEPRIRVTVSIGLASYPVHARDKESLLRVADDAVYRAKETGKNRVRAPRLRLGRLPATEPVVEEEVAE